MNTPTRNIGSSASLICLALITTLALFASTQFSHAQSSRTILAVGAHAGDMELTAGAALIKHARQGDRVVLLHLTLGEGGNPSTLPSRPN